MRKLWIYIAGCAVGIVIIIWMLVLIFVNNANEPEKQNPTFIENINASTVDNKNNGQKMVNSDNMEQNTMDKISYYLRFENDKVDRKSVV